MNEKAELIRGLTSPRRYVPYWCQYDDKESQDFVENSECNKYYYLPKAEKQLIQDNVKVSLY